ncbi:MAG TPA: DEAD/DEAH box helicase, partial [Alphaproteobacteria bacterium]|nr:DEAD/DEAH box helicase [Alphaproteobacteria bacterium]
MQNFSSFGLPEQLLRTLENMKFVTPTPIQAQAIPPALQGKDILGSAQTGTGKTAAFSIPMIVRLLSNPDSSALILTPTRELATQVVEMVGRLLGKGSGIRIALLIGGDSMTKQFEQLRAKARIVVGTPGRINDHLQRGSLTLDRTDFLVLDETDRMLDMGFGPQLERIAKYLTAPRQTLLFSATLPSDILKLASKYVKDPVRIAIDPVTKPADKVKHELIQTSESEKYGHLVSQLDERQGSILVFVKTKRNADRLCIKLHKEEHSVDTIHGDLRQNKRERVIQAFRNRKYRILIATDIAARGLDIPHIEHVINYDLPQSPEDFIHRIGRTARAGAAGLAVSFITSQDGAKWKAIHKLLNPDEKTSK